MISSSEAVKIIEANVQPLSPVSVRLSETAGKILAEDIFAPVDIPAFRQSSMDGYAFGFENWKKHSLLTIVAEATAGSNTELVLTETAAARIFTGAPIPGGADTVIMQEKASVENGILRITGVDCLIGDHVRPVGAEIKKGMLALGKGDLLSPPAIGFLAGLGIDLLTVYPMPRISIILTGNELQQPGHPLTRGQVYESNSFALKAALLQLGITESKVYEARDTAEDVTDRLKECLLHSDLILLTGGVSVGDYDFVLAATIACGVEQLFHKVKQRPGKPLYFGRKKNTIVFGLPGNPSSVLTCFYEYVLTAISLLSQKNITLKKVTVPLEENLPKNAGLTHFLKGCYNGRTVTRLEGQESYKMNSFARANCLIKVEEETTAIQKGELAEIHLLPY